jgi:hypothetical protein
MTGTFARVEKTLIALLSDKDNKVIALTGDWGTGNGERGKPTFGTR